MSGQRVRCADSGDVWVTTLVAGDDPTHSERRQGLFKSRGLLHSLECPVRSDIHTKARAGAVETTSADALGEH